MIAILQNKLAQISLAAFIAFCIGSGMGYINGKDAQYQADKRQADEQTIRQYQLLQSIESKAQNAKKINDIKFKELNNEILKTTDDLRTCKLNASSVRIIYKSAVQNPTSDSGYDATISGVFANRESELTAQDITLTLLNHDQAYFNCKAVVEQWQNWYSHMSHIN